MVTYNFNDVFSLNCDTQSNNSSRYRQGSPPRNKTSSNPSLFSTIVFTIAFTSGLEILDTYIVESCGDLEEHQKLIDEKVKELDPEYYTVDTDLIRLLWKTKIIVMKSK